MNNNLSTKERAYIGLVKQLPCSVCDAPAPSSAHHVKQSCQYTVVALCWDCHQGPTMGWHGQKRMWAIKKMEMMDALDVTVKRVVTLIMSGETNEANI